MKALTFPVCFPIFSLFDFAPKVTIRPIDTFLLLLFTIYVYLESRCFPMLMNHSLSYERYSANKDYFDSGLINLLEKQQFQIKKLKRDATIRQATIYGKNAVIKTLKFKNKDLNILTYNLKNKLRDSKDNADALIEEIDTEIKNINKKIDDELQKSYAENNELYEELQRIRKENEKLRREVDKLTQSTNLDSSNSSLPPSTDMYKKPTNSREPSTKKRGGQPGHKVHTSKIRSTPDKIIEKIVSKAPTGASPVFNDVNEIVYYVTQVIDARFVTTVTETRYFIDKEATTLPDTIMKAYKINSVTYANSFKSTVLYLNSKGTIALNRLCIMLHELSTGEIDLSPGTVINWSAEFYTKSQDARDKIIEEIIENKVVHVDETGWKIDGKNAWMHVLCTRNGAYFQCTKKRCDDYVGPLKILENYEGYLVHDHFKPYYRLTKSAHCECNCHILRYLRAGLVFDENLGCAKLMDLFKQMNAHKKRLLEEGITKMEDAKRKGYEERYLRIIEDTLREYYEKYPNIKRKYVPNYIKTMERLKVYKREHLRFIEDFTVPFENNRAELQMRPTKTKKKVSGQSINITTANYFAAIHTINQTCILQNQNTLQMIEDILNGKDVFISYNYYSSIYR